MPHSRHSGWCALPPHNICNTDNWCLPTSGHWGGPSLLPRYDATCGRVLMPISIFRTSLGNSCECHDHSRCGALALPAATAREKRRRDRRGRALRVALINSMIPFLCRYPDERHESAFFFFPLSLSLIILLSPSKSRDCGLLTQLYQHLCKNAVEIAFVDYCSHLDPPSLL